MSSRLRKVLHRTLVGAALVVVLGLLLHAAYRSEGGLVEIGRAHV